jgi:competence protein ComEA
MADPSATPVPPIPPMAPAPASDSHVSRRTQLAALALLLAVAGLIGWRWYSDRYRARPAELSRDVVHQIDINRATKSELLQIPGLGPQLADRIVSDRETQGRFANVEDLNRVHGIGSATLNKIRPWVTIQPTEEEPPIATPDRLSRKPAPTTRTTKKPASNGRIDINTATLAELRTLPNIGPVLGQNIITEREKKPFANVEDLRRVSGIGPKRLEALRELVTVGE